MLNVDAQAQGYVEINPQMYVLNDLEAQHWLFCRRTVYKVLKEYNIPTPKHVFCNRGEKDWPDSNFQEVGIHPRHTHPHRMTLPPSFSLTHTHRITRTYKHA